MAELTYRERRELLWRFAEHALSGLAANPSLAVEIAGNGSPADVVADAAWMLAMKMVARYEPTMDAE